LKLVGVFVVLTHLIIHEERKRKNPEITVVPVLGLRGKRRMLGRIILVFKIILVSVGVSDLNPRKEDHRSE